MTHRPDALQIFVLDGVTTNLAEREGFCAALILQAVGISLRKFSCIFGRSKVQNGSRFGSRYHSASLRQRLPENYERSVAFRCRVPAGDVSNHTQNHAPSVSEDCLAGQVDVMMAMMML